MIIIHAVKRVAVAAVLVAGCFAVAASGSSSKSTGTKSKAPAVPGQTKAPSGPTSDVTIAKCALASNELEGPNATLTVTNHSSKPSNYFITVTFESPDGKTQLDTGNANVQNLSPGQTATVDAPSLKSELRGQPFTCRVADVTRFSAVG